MPKITFENTPDAFLINGVDVTDICHKYDALADEFAELMGTGGLLFSIFAAYYTGMQFASHPLTEHDGLMDGFLTTFAAGYNNGMDMLYPDATEGSTLQ